MKELARNSAPVMAAALLLLAGACPGAAFGEGTYRRSDSEDVSVFFPPQLQGAADEVAERFPVLREALAARLGWTLRGRTAVWLVGQEERFRRMIGSRYFAAFVLPEKGVVVIDATKMRRRGMMLETTLNHEMCHLLLHQYIPRAHLPRWLDEGIAQWYSDGMSELLIPGRGAALRRAAVSGSIPDIEQLDRLFSGGQEAVALAYDASRSIVDYVVTQYGVDVLLRLLDGLKEGSPEVVFAAVAGRSLADIEDGWQRSLARADAWWLAASAYLYEILFFLAALMTCIAFIRQAIRRRRYVDAEDDGPEDA